MYPPANTEKWSLLVKVRRLVVATSSTATAPSYVQGRLARGEPLPRLALAAVSGANKKTKERRHKLRSMLAFFLGMKGGPTDEGMPWDVFRVVLDMLMPSWDPLRRGVATLQV